MSAAIAMAPSPAPHDRTSSSYVELATAAKVTSSAPPPPASAPAPPLPASSSPYSRTVLSTASAVAPNTDANGNSHSNSPALRPSTGSPPRRPQSQSQSAKSSPPSASRHGSMAAPKVIVKKEPHSPDLPTARHRPQRLDLSKNTITGSGAQTARLPSTRDGLGIQQVGLACLSPGFVTQDPVMKEQLQRSMNVREQQRTIIEARLQQSAKGNGPDHGRDHHASHFTAKTPGISSRRHRAPPGLSIVAPSHEQFANERVIQSAPLGHSFTGRHNPHPLTRHITNQPSNLANTSHMHHEIQRDRQHGHSQQTSNRLPPIADVFGQQGLNASHPDTGAGGHRGLHAGLGSTHGPQPSPAHTPQYSQPLASAGPRDFRSAEEAQHELAGGRAELLPKIVHYTSHPPPTPPSPRRLPSHDTSRSASKRRTRAEYEEGASPPLGSGPPPTRRRGPSGAGRDSPETQQQKREEFLRLCERAWDLFHS